MKAILFALVFCGCSSVPALYKSAGTLAIGVSVGTKALQKVDHDTQAAIVVKAKTDAPAAKHDLDEWLPKYNKANTALDAASIAVNEVTKAIAPIEALATSPQKRQVTLWLVTLAKLGLDVVASLGTVGIKLNVPGLGGQ